MAPQNETDPNRDYPSKKEDHWFTLAVTGGILTLVLASFTGVWIFSHPDAETRARLAASITPFGTLMIAAVTFCTVAWRGLVGSRQADQQRRQNDATDDANFAKLLQEGAKLIADGSSTNQLAGVASLNVLLTEPKKRFATEARDVLAEAFKSLYTGVLDGDRLFSISTSSTHSSLITLLANEASAGRFSNVDLVVTSPYVKGTRAYWPFIAGMRGLIINGGSIARPASEFREANKIVRFVGVRFVGGSRDIDLDFSSCIFEHSRITSIATLDNGTQYHQFLNCDFSNCTISEYGASVISNFQFENCWFDVENAPQCDGEDITLYIQPRIKIEDTWKTMNQVSRKHDPLTPIQRDLILKYDR